MTERAEALAEQILATVKELTRDVSNISITSVVDDLALRDYALGMLAELGEARARLQRAEFENESLTERLRLEMTRAYEAESNLGLATDRLAREMTRAHEAESRIDLMINSFTWKLGRFFMLPIRALRRITR